MYVLYIFVQTDSRQTYAHTEVSERQSEIITRIARPTALGINLALLIIHGRVKGLMYEVLVLTLSLSAAYVVYAMHRLYKEPRKFGMRNKVYVI